MLIARLLGWFKGHQTTTVFVLEILAVFIGITASLLIDDWRQERNDRNRLNQILTEIYANVVENRTYYQTTAVDLTRAAEDSLALARQGSGSTIVSEGGNSLGMVLVEPFVPRWPVGLERLVSSDMLGDFDQLRTDIDYYHHHLQSQSRKTQILLDVTTNLQIEVLRSSGVIFTQGDPTSLDQVESASSFQRRVLDVARIGRSDIDKQSLDDHNVAAMRTALENEEFRKILTTLASMHIDGASEALKMEIWADSLIAAIEAFEPAVRPRYGEIGIDGTATGNGISVDGGPSLTVSMSQSEADPDVWQLTADLVSGDLKFRADNNWTYYWGTPYTYRNLSRDGGEEFVGNPAEVFPQGTSELLGLFIPIRSGRYEISFNSRTLEYSFQLVDEPDL